MSTPLGPTVLESTADSTEQLLTTIDYDSNTGMRVTLGPDDTAFKNAPAGSYKSKVTFNVTAP